MTNSRNKADLQFYADIGFTTGEAAKAMECASVTVRKWSRILGVHFPHKPILARRFHKSYKRCEATGCWIWSGANRGNGYGCIADCGVLLSAHRVSVELSGRKILEGAVVRHKCDTPACVNPSHLIVGTHAENTRDAISRERTNPPKGESHHASKLTKQDVLDIRRSDLGSSALASKYNVCASSITKIKKRRAWRHVN